jgi:hypothetical protein
MIRSKLLLATLVLAMGMLSLPAEEVTIGIGSLSTTAPIYPSVYSSLFECLYYNSELNMLPGSTISGVKFYNNYFGPCGSTIKIWLGYTTLSHLGSAWILPTNLTLVYDGYVDLPAGENTIPVGFTTNYTYTGGTLVMMISRPQQTPTSMSGSFKGQALTQYRARWATAGSMNPANINPYAPPPVSPSQEFPKTTFVYTSSATTDLSAVSINGDKVVTAGNTYTFTVAVKNMGSDAQSDYTVSLCNSPNLVLATTGGLPIAQGQTINYDLEWTPSSTGTASLFGKVTLSGDQLSANDNTPGLSVYILPVGTAPVTYGEGGESGPLPVDISGVASLSETVYPASELGNPETIYAVRYYQHQFQSYVNNQYVALYMGETDQPDLQGGWIPSTQLTQVFAGLVSFPSGQNQIDIVFATPYSYNSGNLVLMAHYSGISQGMQTNVFVTQTQGSHRTRSMSTFMGSYDPANPSGGGITGMYPQATFFEIPGLPTPDNLSITHAEAAIHLDWDDVTQDFAGQAVANVVYEVYQGDTPYFDCNPDSLLTTVASSFLSLDPYLHPEDEWFFRIKAVRP